MSDRENCGCEPLWVTAPAVAGFDSTDCLIHGRTRTRLMAVSGADRHTEALRACFHDGGVRG